MAVPDTMRVSVLRAPGELALERRPIPAFGPREVLVRVLSVGTCGSDTHYYRHGRIGRFVVRAPLVLGHEPAGEVVAVGAEVERVRPGQRVSLEPGVPCFTCPLCASGRYNLCPRMRFFATPPVDGAFAEYVVHHEAMAHPVPDTVSDDAAALLEPLSVAIWACRKAGVGPGSRVLVSGAGPVGLLAVQAARAFGAAEVAVTDLRWARLSLARDLGASRAVDMGADTGPKEVSGFAPDILIECSGSPEATAGGVLALGGGGRAVLVGMGGDTVALPLSHVQDNEITVTGVFRYANTWPTAIALASARTVDLDRLVTHHFGLADVEGALGAGAEDPTAVKVVVRPQA
ncbi:NAD(P)-dependent alcohol dehydrogenase [Actinokineospora iranica]|uniref:L-iditol 2-dehydrogenase n=1 Tax=Actinokineospora iranica TaxID=1271860 RepID=A0A1G6WKB0_9PSEU|nr:NAD(P)-dependent alcohol dehydrogenase [Actinokineospora iranica]SDD66219.1 L-iditol 2-dehydrogenase [Actinokineospora iranica]